MNEKQYQDPVRVHFDEETGYLLVQLSKSDYGFHERTATYQGKTFQPKSELHITIVSREAAEVVANCYHHSLENQGRIQALINSTRWSYHRLDDFYHIKEGEEETIIQMVEMPELGSFFSTLSGIVGQGLLLPPVHVTLYTYQSEWGIGLPNGEVFERLSQGRIRRSQFLPPENT